MALPESVFNFIKDYIDAKVKLAIEQALSDDNDATIEIREYEVTNYGEPVYVKVPTYITPSGTYSATISSSTSTYTSTTTSVLPTNLVFTGSDGNLYTYVVPSGVTLQTTDDGKLYYVDDNGHTVYVLLPNETINTSTTTTNTTTTTDGSTYGSLDYSTSTTETTTDATQDPSCAVYFDGINITSRGVELDGYEITYNPEEPIYTDEINTYTVIATVKHIESGCVNTYTFEETTYPQDAYVDKYGRQIIGVAYLEPETCVDEEIIEYSKNNPLIFVKPNTDDEIDNEVVKLFKEVLSRTIIDSEGFNYAYNLIKNKGYDEACKQIALDAQTYINVLPKAAYDARCYLGSIGYDKYDTKGRVPLKICDLLANDNGYIDSQCLEHIQTTDQIFVAPFADNIDSVIYDAYKTVLGRTYVDNGGAIYWREQILTGNVTSDDIKEALANGALPLLESRVCVYAGLKALKYIKNTDQYGREYYDVEEVLYAYHNDRMTQADKECFDYTINNADLIKEWYVKPNPNYSEDSDIAYAYSRVLGRNYIDSSGFNYWFSEYRTNDWTLYDLEKYIAGAVINSDSTICPTVRENAINWNIAYGDVNPYSADPFGDGSCIAFYPLYENANDYTGNGYDGEWIGNEQYKDGFAYFDGDSYIKTKLIYDKYKDVTVSYVFSYTDVSRCGTTFTFSHNGENTLNIFVCKDYMKPHFDDVMKKEVDVDYSDGSIHHFVITNNSFYIDGKKIFEIDNALDMSKVDLPLIIGADYDSPTTINDLLTNNSKIKNFRVFNRKLNEEEINILCKNEIGALK